MQLSVESSNPGHPFWTSICRRIPRFQEWTFPLSLFSGSLDWIWTELHHKHNVNCLVLRENFIYSKHSQSCTKESCQESHLDLSLTMYDTHAYFNYAPTSLHIPPVSTHPHPHPHPSEQLPIVPHYTVYDVWTWSFGDVRLSTVGRCIY